MPRIPYRHSPSPQWINVYISIGMRVIPFPKLYRRNSVAVTTTHRIWNNIEERLHFNTFARNHGTSSTRMNMTWSNKTNLTHKAHSNIYHLLLAFSLSLLSLLLKYLIENMHYYTFQQYTKFQINEWAILYEKFKICRLSGANKNQKTQKIQFEDQWKCTKTPILSLCAFWSGILAPISPLIKVYTFWFWERKIEMLLECKHSHTSKNLCCFGQCFCVLSTVPFSFPSLDSLFLLLPFFITEFPCVRFASILRTYLTTVIVVHVQLRWRCSSHSVSHLFG